MLLVDGCFGDDVASGSSSFCFEVGSSSGVASASCCLISADEGAAPLLFELDDIGTVCKIKILMIGKRRNLKLLCHGCLVKCK